MSEAYTIVSSLDEFRAAREQFGYLVNKLQSEETAALEHGDVESLIDEEGTEVLRRLLQGYVDLRAAREVRREQVVGSDGVERSQCRSGTQTGLMSLFGEVEVRRKGYKAKEASSLFPLDAELNLAPDKYSDGMRRRVATALAKELPRLSLPTGRAGRHLDYSGAGWMGQLLPRGALKSLFRLREGLGREEDSAPSDARAQASGFWLTLLW